MWGTPNPIGPSNPAMICQTTPLTLSVPSAHFSPNHCSQQITKAWLNCSGTCPVTQIEEGNRTVCCTPGRNYHATGLKDCSDDLSHTIVRSWLQGPLIFPILPIWAKKKVSRSLLDTSNYPWGPWRPVLSGCTLTLSLKPFNKAGVIPTTGAAECAFIRVQTVSNTHKWIYYKCVLYI